MSRNLFWLSDEQWLKWTLNLGPGIAEVKV